MQKIIETKALTKVYGLIVSRYTGDMKTITILAMGTLLNIRPLSLYVKSIVVTTVIRLQIAASWRETWDLWTTIDILREKALDKVLALGGDCW